MGFVIDFGVGCDDFLCVEEVVWLFVKIWCFVEWVVVDLLFYCMLVW